MFTNKMINLLFVFQAIAIAGVILTAPVTAHAFTSLFGDSDFPSLDLDLSSDESETESIFESHTSVTTECKIFSSASTVDFGGSVTITWDTTGFTDIKLNGETISQTKGSKTFTDIQENSVYKLVATNSNGDRCQTQVNVSCLIPPVHPPICESFTANPDKITKGNQSVLTWDTTNATRVAINNGIGEVSLDGSTSVSPIISTTYVLTAWNDDGDKVFCEEHITVEEKEIPVRCEDFGYDFEIGKFEWNGSKYVPESTISGHTINVTGTTNIANWTANPAVAGVVAKAGTNVAEFTGGTSGTVSKSAIGSGHNAISNIAFCGNDVPKQCELEIKKTADKHTADLGEVITYTIDVKNIGDADCTGGGVKIEDVLDTNLTLHDYTYTSNLTAGYGGYSVYTESDRTIRFNGNVLTPGEGGSIVLFVKAVKPAICGDFEVTNKARVTAKELSNFTDWVYSNTVKTTIDNDCIVEPKKATIVAEKVVCTDESQLPNWGTGGPNITANTAANWVAANDSCSLVPGWEFEWTDNQSSDPGDTLVGRAGAPWNNFGSTGIDGKTQTTINLDTLTNDRLWFREVLKTGFIPFTHGLNGGTNVDNVSAEFYCHTDVINYDNRDFITGLEKDQTYHCVAFNSPEVEVLTPTCDSFVASANTITLGATTTLTWETTNAVSVLINNGVGSVAVDGDVQVSPANNTTYELTATGVDGTKAYCEVPVTVTTIPVPSCDLFTANPTNIVVGDSSTLTWESTNAVQAFLNNGIGAVATSGTISVSPLADITYRLTLIGAEDKVVDCEVPVLVSEDPVPVCEFFTATPSALPVGGGSSQLAWEVSDATTVVIDNGVGSVGLVGTQSVNVTESITYTLTATDIDGDEVSCIAPIAVADPEPVFTCAANVDFTASDNSIDRGDSSTLTWTVTGADSVTVIGSGIDATGLTGNQSVSPSSDANYVLTATKSGFDTIECPLSIDVSSGGGGGGSSSPRCELDISDNRISRGEEITLTWDSSRATELTLSDDRGNIIVTTEDKLSDDKDELFDGEITLRPTRDTEYTLLVERGSRDRECNVDVEIVDDIVVLETRDQAPLVAGISLTQVPYTGFEAGPVMTVLFYMLLVAWALYLTYVLVIPKSVLATQSVSFQPKSTTDLMKQAEGIRPDAFAPLATDNNLVMSAPAVAPTVTAPVNLPTADVHEVPSYIEEAVSQPVAIDVATEIENEAHAQQALLSSGAVQSIIAMTTDVNRSEMLKKVIDDAKGSYPIEDGWVVINQERLDALTATTSVPQTTVSGAGSLAEAIVTGNVVAAYDMIGERPMFALADASADLDAVYRNRKGGTETVSDLLATESANLSDSQIVDMIAALTGALDGMYTDEASAVKMAIMKAVKVAA